MFCSNFYVIVCDLCDLCADALWVWLNDEPLNNTMSYKCYAVYHTIVIAIIISTLATDTHRSTQVHSVLYIYVALCQTLFFVNLDLNK